jgi:MFS family permease
LGSNQSNESPEKHQAALTSQQAPQTIISRKSRYYIITAALLALFLGALDALVMSAAMPTIIADLGGLHLYSWVYSAYLLARAVSLPIFGKLADIFNSKRLFIITISIFLMASIFAGLAQTMTQLILWRVFQGIGGGGIFALVYIVLADISSPESRAKNLSLGSFIWGLASVLGPTFGGFVVTYFSWRWIFFVNVPLSMLSLLGIGFCLVEIREKKKEAAIDYLGALTRHRLSRSADTFNRGFRITHDIFISREDLLLGFTSNHPAYTGYHCIKYCLLLQRKAGPGTHPLVGFFRNQRL